MEAENQNPAADPADQPAEHDEDPELPVSMKKFVMKHTFEDAEQMEDHEHRHGIAFENEHLVVILADPADSKRFSIEAHVKFRFTIGGEEGLGFEYERSDTWEADDDDPFDGFYYDDFIDWELIEDLFDPWTVEVEVQIIKMAEIVNTDLRRFDESVKDLSDLILVVQDKKFYVSKLLLATHSTYFRTLLMGQLAENNTRVVVINRMDPLDIQKFLEVLYLEPAINETTVEGLLLVSEWCGCGKVKKLCEGFLFGGPQLTIWTLFHLFTTYNLDTREFIGRLIHVEVINKLIPEDPTTLHPEVLEQLLARRRLLENVNVLLALLHPP